MAKRNIVKTKPCKFVKTFDPQSRRQNGWLLEIVSDRDNFTKHLKGQVYLTVVMPGSFKGYHLHAGADYFVTCLKGKAKEIIYKGPGIKQEIKMGDGNFVTTFLPKGFPHAIQNMGKEPAYFLVYRYPAWSAAFKEQFDIPREKINEKKSWDMIGEFINDFKSQKKK